MKKLIVDIKMGKFVLYPSGEVLSSLEGYISHSYFRLVGDRKQLKVVIIDGNKEFTLNATVGNLAFESLVTTLIGEGGKVNLVLQEKTGMNGNYYLVENTNKEE